MGKNNKCHFFADPFLPGGGDLYMEDTLQGETLQGKNSAAILKKVVINSAAGAEGAKYFWGFTTKLRKPLKMVINSEKL